MHEEYTLLFNTITDIISELRNMESALMAAQAQAEELYLQRTD